MRTEPKPTGYGVVFLTDPAGPDACLVTPAARQRAQLNNVARLQPIAVLGVLGYWLAPCTVESQSHVDC